MPLVLLFPVEKYEPIGFRARQRLLTRSLAKQKVEWAATAHDDYTPCRGREITLHCTGVRFGTTSNPLAALQGSAGTQ